MAIHNDLTFFTNEPERNLYDRFGKILKSNTQFFDVLVGYFRTSGFYLMHPAMKDVEKIRVLVGLNVDGKTVQIINKSKEQQMSFELSHKQVKEEFSKDIVNELQNSEDSHSVEEGIRTFIDWLKSGKIEMRVYPEAPIHAKVYIMRKDMEKVPDQYGSVITGSSNFSKAGLVNNLEFNVELKDSRDVDFALEKFEELWSRSIEISEDYIETTTTDTWIRDDITPYELYLKTLYEFFKEEINEDKSESWENILPDGFMKLQYQVDAVTQAKKIIDAYNGVFISDVVGLGKTFICAMLAQKLKGGRKLVICPPVLKEYWTRTLEQFEVSATVESLGKLDKILEDEDLMKNIKYVFVDEAHRFRNEKTGSFEKLHQICRNKKVILITATPQNNYSTDIANQLYLFQSKNNSTIPGVKNLESFFGSMERELKKLDRGSTEYMDTLRENSEKIRDRVLREVMIRRTRNEIVENYKDDMENQGLNFPKLENPEKIVYTYDDETEEVFNDTIKSIKSLKYARYSPLTYLREVSGEDASLITSQRNMSGFMKSVLVKRLESSFEAFRKTLGRFIESHEKFIDMSKGGKIYISKKVDVYDLMDNGDEDRLMELVEEERVKYYPIESFEDRLIPELEQDLKLLKELQQKWNSIDSDPKKDDFLKALKTEEKLRGKKIIIFSESKETAEYVGKYLDREYPEKVVVFSGQDSNGKRKEIEANYNPGYLGEKKDDIQFLVTTDVLAEGINLHRSNVIVNYDLPWNPTKIMQRVGRINRVGTEHEEIYVFNFFPTAQANMHLPLEENIVSKIQSFHDTVGEDFKYLSEDEEVSSHSLYQKLNSKESIEGEEESMKSELKYLKLIREIRDNDEELYLKIKKLPQKSRTGRMYGGLESNKTLSFMRKGAIKKFLLGDSEDSKEDIGFMQAMRYLEVEPDEKREAVPKEYFDHLEMNKLGFSIALSDSSEEVSSGGKTGGSKINAQVIKLLNAISNCRTFTEQEEEILKKMMSIWKDGGVPITISKDIAKRTKGMNDPVKIFYEIKNTLPEQYLEDRKGQKKTDRDGEIKIILSSYLKKGD